MFRLLKNLFSVRDGSRTVVIVNDDGSKPSSSFRANPVSLWMAFLGIIASVIILVVVLIRFTPVGGLVYDQQKMRDTVIAIQQKVASLQDTIQARNTELSQMKQVIFAGKDTTFNNANVSNAVQPSQDQSASTHDYGALQQQPKSAVYLPADAALISNLFRDAPHFPAPYPVEGSTTRTFNADNGHFGLDIAASTGKAFHAIADGVIVSEEWTFNYGYMIIVQHADGVISIYKHARTMDKAIGQTVRQGDILGTVGNVGILSSGPHLHVEIWKNGIPQDPANYLIKS